MQLRQKPRNMVPKILEDLREGDLGITYADESITMIKAVCETSSHWFISDRVMDLVEKTDLVYLEEDEEDEKTGTRSVALRLPHPTMTVEFEKNGVGVCLVLHASEELDSFVIYVFSCAKDTRFFMGRLFKDGEHVIHQSPQGEKSKLREFDTCGMHEKLCWASFHVMMRFAGILDCDNVPVREIKAPNKLNKKRVRSGRSPIPRYKTIHISDHSERPGSNHTGPGSHASPKCHWRRGHFRNVRTKKGDKRRWIKPTIVAGTSPEPEEIVLT